MNVFIVALFRILRQIVYATVYLMMTSFEGKGRLLSIYRLSGLEEGFTIFFKSLNSFI